MTTKKEIRFVIGMNTAKDCAAESLVRGPGFVDVVESIQNGAEFSELMPIATSCLEKELALADGLICVCDDGRFPGFEIAYFSHKRSSWMRLRTDEQKVAKIGRSKNPVSQTVSDKEGNEDE